MIPNFNRAKAHSFLSAVFCSMMIATAIASFASCDSRKKFNVQEFENNFRAAVAIEKRKQESNKYEALPQSFAHIQDPYGSAKRAIEIFDEEIAKGQLVFIERLGNSTDNPLAISESYGKTFNFTEEKERYYSENGVLYYAALGWFMDYGKIVHLGGSPVFFISVIKDNNYKKYFQDTYGISEELANFLGELSYTKHTKRFIEYCENTVLSLTKPELVSESESAIIHKVKDINSGYVFLVTEEWSADGKTSKKSFKFEDESKIDDYLKSAKNSLVERKKFLGARNSKILQNRLEISDKMIIDTNFPAKQTARKPDFFRTGHSLGRAKLLYC